MDEIREFLVGEEEEGDRLDVYLSEQLGDMSRSYIQKIIKDKKVEAKKIKGECDLHLSINTFTQLAFSYIDIKEAMILNNINKNEKNKEVIDLFEILFNKKENYINEYV